MIFELVNDCIELEAERGIAKTTIKELNRYLHEFANYCQQKSISVELDFPQKSRHRQAQSFTFCFSYSEGQRYPSVECLLCRL